jgi:hypothetical protein
MTHDDLSERLRVFEKRCIITAAVLVIVLGINSIRTQLAVTALGTARYARAEALTAESVSKQNAAHIACSERRRARSVAAELRWFTSLDKAERLPSAERAAMRLKAFAERRENLEETSKISCAQ